MASVAPPAAIATQEKAKLPSASTVAAILKPENEKKKKKVKEVRKPTLVADVLHNCINRAVAVELKSGECYNGVAKKIDAWMNLDLINVTRTSADGLKCWELREAVLRGNSIKNIRMHVGVMLGPAVGASSSTRGGDGVRGRGLSSRGRGADRGRGGSDGRGRGRGDGASRGRGRGDGNRERGRGRGGRGDGNGRGRGGNFSRGRGGQAPGRSDRKRPREGD